MRPELVFANLLWEGVAITAWSLGWGLLAAMTVLAAGVVALAACSAGGTQPSHVLLAMLDAQGGSVKPILMKAGADVNVLRSG